MKKKVCIEVYFKDIVIVFGVDLIMVKEVFENIVYLKNFDEEFFVKVMVVEMGIDLIKIM